MHSTSTAAPLAHAALVLPALVLAGCATQSIDPAVLASADYGPPPSDQYEQLIRDRFAQILIDPTSPLYEFGTPSKGYTKPSPMYGTSLTFGWRVCGTVNSKNRFGGYTGKAPFFVLFRGDQIVFHLIGETYASGYVIANAGIQEACTRPAGP